MRWFKHMYCGTAIWFLVGAFVFVCLNVLYLGWPLTFNEVVIVSHFDEINASAVFNHTSFFFDVLFDAALLASTAFLCERFIRARGENETHKFFRIGLSTAVILMLVVPLGALAIVGVRVQTIEWAAGNKSNVFVHGWPFVYGDDSIKRFDMLLLDMAVVLVAIIYIVQACEWHIRRRENGKKLAPEQ